jgi:hypothetical protein
MLDKVLSAYGLTVQVDTDTLMWLVHLAYLDGVLAPDEAGDLMWQIKFGKVDITRLRKAEWNI